MSVTKKIRWKRNLSKLRYSHEERDLVREMSKEAAAEFQQYYEEFCAKNNIDIKEMNDTHRERINEMYGKKDIEEEQEDINFGSVGSYDLQIHSNPDKPIEHVYFDDKDADEVHAAFAKLFKKIAILLHPDKVSQEKTGQELQNMIALFKEANDALKTRRYFVLLDIADRYDITTPRNYDQQNRWMKKEIETIEHDIEKEKKTYNYLFSDTKTDEERDDLIRKFIYQLFQINIP
jgi:hypothetical protein